MRKYVSIFPSLLHLAGFGLVALCMVAVGVALTYAACPDPEVVCATHDPGSVFTNWCAFDDCFEMNFSEEARLMARDNQGPYPDTLFAWSHDGEFNASELGCPLKKQGSKTLIGIPPERGWCSMKLQTPSNLYHWHFMSSPIFECMGWIECTYNGITKFPELTPTQGPIGTLVTVDVLFGEVLFHMEPGDELRFVIPAADPFVFGVPATNTWISPDGYTLQANVPSLSNGGWYELAVVSPIMHVVRFRSLSFDVTL